MTSRPILIGAFVLLTSTFALAPAQPLQNAGSAQSAAGALYRRDCAICHGANGDGKSDLIKDEQLTVSDWTDPKSLSGRTDEQLFSIIRFGKNRMPSESVGRASNEQAHALIQYIRSMAKTALPASASPAAIK